MSGSIRPDDAMTTQGTLLVECFAALGSDVRRSLASTRSPLLVGLAALAIASRDCHVEYLSVEDIVGCLEAAGVSTNERTIQKAFARAGSRISRRQFNGSTKYRAMTTGIEAVLSVISPGSLQILYIEGSQPRTDKKQLVRCPGDSFTKSLDFLKDRIGRGGPDERMAVMVVVGNEIVDSRH